MKRKSNRPTYLLKTITIVLALQLISLYSTTHAQNSKTSQTVLLKHLHELYTQDDSLGSAKLVSQFYQSRRWRPAWINHENFTSMAHELLSQLNTADHDGLIRSIYHVNFIDSKLKRDNPTDLRTAIELDLLLTDAYLTYSNHLLHGYLRKRNKHEESRELDLGATLSNALSQGTIEQSLRNHHPVLNTYMALKKALADYHKVNLRDQHRILDAEPALQLNDSGPRVLLLKEKLANFEGTITTSGDVFDHNLDQAVRRFQYRHGLEVDGIAGTETIAALNIPLDERIKQIEINMDRLRWLPRNPGNKFILVNIPDFTLWLIEDDQTTLTSRVIVGKPDHETPVFSKRMDYLVFSPNWHVPDSIAVKEILPKIRKDTGYLTKHNIRVFDRITGHNINPLEINWKKLTKLNFPYRFRQQSGPTNAMGKVKFIFPNRHSIYLHDTPNKRLFTNRVRNFSHGCIRVEKSITLANYLLADRPAWNSDNVNEAVKSGEEVIVHLSSPVPVHIVYLTAWVEHDVIQFRQDIYKRDQGLLTALERLRR